MSNITSNPKVTIDSNTAGNPGITIEPNTAVNSKMAIDSNITIQKISSEIENQITEIWGGWVKEYGCLHYGDGCCSLAALWNGKPVGFISAYPLQYPAPLQAYQDAYIDNIEVLPDFRRQGIAARLLAMTEQWAKDYGYRQLRSWSSDDKTEALAMWYALGYGICPAIMRGVSVKKGFEDKPICGFYVVKTL